MLQHGIFPLYIIIVSYGNKLNHLLYISKHFNNKYLTPFSFVSLTHVCHHTQGWSTQNTLLLINFLWADSQNSINLLVLHTCETWVKQCCQECSRDYNYDFLICHIIIKCENITHQDKNVGVFKFALTQTCVHMNSYGKGIIYPGSLDVGSQNPSKSE